MKIVVASDSFKGSLDAIEIADIVEKIAKTTFQNCIIKKLPMADGGEGTVDSIIYATNGAKVTCTVKDPLMRDMQAEYGVFGDTAIMEMASASGITLVADNERDIMRHTTYGTGQMLLHAINNGYTKIKIGIGGSATNDGGIGFASAIGVIFLDENNEVLEPVPLNFTKIVKVDISNINPLISKTDITVMSDVTNPLLGELGATNIFGKQKGANNEQRQILEQGLTNYINVTEKALNKDVRNSPGAGAAGGLGAGLKLFTNAQMCSGVDTILDVLNFEQNIKDADLVITGEGMMDYQSAYGKVASGVGKMCKANNIPCIAIVGSMGDQAEEMYKYGIHSIVPIVNCIMPLENAICNAKELYECALRRTFNLVKVGMQLKN